MYGDIDFQLLPPAVKRPKASRPVERRLVRYVSHEEIFDATNSQLELFESHFEEKEDHWECEVCHYFQKCSFSPPETEAPPVTRRTPSPVPYDVIV